MYFQDTFTVAPWPTLTDTVEVTEYAAPLTEPRTLYPVGTVEMTEYVPGVTLKL
ncbi:MAG TPA: hypothetical protein VII08_01745 [Myxococcales bacterium]